jgi:DHA3 family macrolide efflux protein-like MFS transporter
MSDREGLTHRWARRFFTIWTGQQISLIGSQLVQFALIWWMTKRTHSATVLATASLVALLPQILLGPFCGALIDRWKRRSVMIVADLGIALASAGLAYSFYLGVTEIWHVYVVMAIRSVGSGFHWPAMAASTSLMVPKEHLPRVAGLNQSMSGALNVIAPILGALLLAILPMYGILGIDVVTAAIAIVPLLFTPIPQPAGVPSSREARGSVLTQVWEGFRYVASWPGLLFLLVMGAVLNFALSPAASLLPLLVVKHFNGDALHLGWMNAAFGIGLVVGGVTLGVWGGFRKRMATALLGIAGVGFGILGVGLLPGWAFWLAAGGTLFTGLMAPIASGPLISLFQGEVAPEMQGRVLTLSSSVASLMAPLSLGAAGPLADLMGIQFWYIVAGATLLVLGVAGFFVPSVLFLEARAAEHPLRRKAAPPSSPAASG